jgi:hypothetical protein
MVTVTDSDNDSLTLQGTGLPQGASFTITRNDSGATEGVFRWTSTDEQAGDYSVVFSVSDGVGDPVSKVLNIAVQNTNNPPIININGPSSITVNENEEIDFNIEPMDPDGDPLTVTWDNLPGGADVEKDVFFFWQPRPGQVGSYSVKIIANDGKGGITEKDVMITVLAAPTEVPEVVDEGTYLSINISDVWDQYDFESNVIQTDPNQAYSLRNCPGSECTLLLNKDEYTCNGTAAETDPSGRAMLLHNANPYC